jgi:hypothetical protein
MTIAMTGKDRQIDRLKHAPCSQRERRGASPSNSSELEPNDAAKRLIETAALINLILDPYAFLISLAV